MSTIKAVVVDDEKNSRETIMGVLEQFCQGVEVVGSAGDVDTAIGVIANTHPDVVFLDVEMGQKSGFNLLEEIGDPDFQVIFVTAFDQYAIKAFKFCAVEYLLKPLDLEELQEAIAKVRENIDLKAAKLNLSHLLHNLRDKDPATHKIAIPVSQGYEFVRPSEIVYFEAHGNYSTAYLASGKKLMVSKTLKFFEQLLDDHAFLRIHHSYYINPDFVRAYSRLNGGELTLEGDFVLPVSRSKKENLLAKLNLS